ncbi:flagellar FliJ family protein [Actinotalea sp. AC32]|nr:flagellar FliJ family protein [Actinotalea sp. AC32]
MSAFRLAGLLRLRQMQEEQAAADLARANAARARAEERRRDTEAMLNDAGLPERSDELAWRAAVAARASLAGMLTESVLTVRSAAAVVDDANAAWSAARTLTTTLGKLEERHDREVRLAEDRAEQLVLDETAGRRAAATAAATAADQGLAPLSQEVRP